MSVELLKKASRSGGTSRSRTIKAGHAFRVPKNKREEQLKLETLDMRRLRYDFIFTHKFIFGLVSGVRNELSTMSDSKIPTRGHSFKLHQRYSRADSRKYFFAESSCSSLEQSRPTC
jgi:hypothetical protein